MDFREQLRRLRKSLGMTQSELAELSGTTQAQVSKVEGGGANVESASLEAMAAALDSEIMIVPRKLAARFRAMIDVTIDPGSAAKPEGNSVADSLFIPDEDEEDSSLRRRGP